MSDLVVIVPSRERPEAAKELAGVFAQTGATARLVFAVDEGDPRRGEYAEVLGRYGPTTVHYIPGPSSMVRALNLTAGLYANEAYAIGFMGDDHRPRTFGWDRLYLEALKEMGTGIVYGDDLFQHERIPTQVAMSADIVRALGFMAPESLTHLYVDDFWKELGEEAGCLRYLPEVVIEHVHPFTGKVLWDAGHLRVNDPEMYQRDRAAYAAYRSAYLAGDIAAVKALRAAG